MKNDRVVCGGGLRRVCGGAVGFLEKVCANRIGRGILGLAMITGFVAVAPIALAMDESQVTPTEDQSNLDSGNGDVCQEENDCDDCHTPGTDEESNEDQEPDDPGPHPVTTDTGEKWELVHDLVVKLKGNDFKLTRQYSSDPKLLDDPYDSPYLPNQLNADGDKIAAEDPYVDLVDFQAPSPIPTPSVSPSLGRGWGFSNLRSMSMAQTMGCVRRLEDPDNPFLFTYGPEFVASKAWLNRPNRKPREYSLPADLTMAEYQISDEAAGPGNQNVLVFPGFTRTETYSSLAHCRTSEPIKIFKYTGKLRFQEPGRWKQDFEIVDNVGFMVFDADEFGNVRVYEDEGTDGVPDIIYLNGNTKDQSPSNPDPDTGSLTYLDPAEAWVQLYWTSSSDPLLARAEVYRPDTNGDPVVTQYVKYFYLDTSDGTKVKHWEKDFDSTSSDAGYTDSGIAPSMDLGTHDDLVQVVTFTAINPEAASATNAMASGVEWRTKVSQYRYHNGAAALTSGDIRLRTTGLDHQVKMEIMPQQIEYAVQKRLAGATGTPTDMDVVDEATDFLELHDISQQGTDPPLYSEGATDVLLYEAAAKIISYDKGQSRVAASTIYSSPKVWTVKSPVDFQFLQAAGCGCGGGGGSGSVNAILRSYEQFDKWNITEAGTDYKGQSMHITEHEMDSFSAFPVDMSDGYRQYTTDLVMLGEYQQYPYLWMEAVIDQVPVLEGGSGLTWAQENVYNWSTRTKTGRVTSSAIASYTKATSGGGGKPIVTYVPTGEGLVYEYGFDSENESVGTVSVGGYNDTLSMVSRTTRRNDKTFRKHLPSESILYRAASGEENFETTTFEYGFRQITVPGFNPQDSGKVAWKKTIVERELAAENGHSGSDRSANYWEFYDDAGQILWSIDADEVITKYTYDELTGELTSITENANPPNPTEKLELLLDGIDPFPDTPGDGGQLVTTIDRDLLGRTTRITTPGDVKSYIARELREDMDRPGILYYSELELPHTLGTTPKEFDGPASVRYVDASGKPTRFEDFEIDTSAAYDPLSGDYTLSSTELSRTSIEHDLSGALVEIKNWWYIDPTDPSDDEYYTTSYEYDGFGRTSKITDGNGTVSERGYDVMNRAVEFKTGTSAGTHLVAELVYDGADPAAVPPIEGVGNGNLTAYIQHDGENQRITRLYYDERDRNIAVISPDSPMTLTRYDNLDRPIEEALYPSSSIDSLANIQSAASSTLPTTLNSVTRSQYSRTNYSQRGLVWRREFKIDPATTADAYLEWNGFYDEDENLIAAWAPNSPGTIMDYDAHDRVKTMYVTDRAGEASSYTYSGAIGLALDHIMEQMEYKYDPVSGALTRIRTYARTHDTIDTGALNHVDENSVISYQAFVYDDAWRRVGTIDHGTNRDGPNPFRADSVVVNPAVNPLDSLKELREEGDLLYQWVTYNTRGLPDTVYGIQDDGTSLTPASSDIETRFVYDDLNRTVATIENAEDVSASDVSWSASIDRYNVSGFDFAEPALDRVTSVVYDAANHVIKRVAHIPVDSGGSVTIDEPQITEYVYGVDYTAPGSAVNLDSFLNSNDLLSEVRYPDESTGLPGTTSEYTVKYAYNRLGEIRGVRDQNQTIHEYERDLQGRVLTDKVGSFGSGIDQEINGIKYAYDDNGRLETVTSYNDSSLSTERDQVVFGYTPLWEIDSIAQQYDGVVAVSSPEVVYEYDSVARTDGTGNYSRVEGVIYPTDSATTVQYNYNSGSDTRLSRISNISVQDWISSGVMSELQSFDYIGMNRIARAEFPNANTYGVVLDRTKDHLGKDQVASNNAYPAFDRYGRVTEHRWVRSDFDEDAVDHANQPAIVEISHTYDRMSNRLTANDTRHQLEMPNTQRAFDYDGLNRLIRENRSDPATVNSSYLNTHRGKQWDLDTLGNWPTVTNDTEDDGNFTGGTDTLDIREYNSANEIDGVAVNYDGYSSKVSAPTLPSQYVDYEYDANGNMTEDRYSKNLPFSGDLSGQIHTYDAWNRLVKTEFNPNSGSDVTIAEYTYNGLGWRTSKEMDVAVGSYDGVDQKRIFLYDAAWRIVEEYIDTDNSGSIDWKSQQFWGIQYIDEAIAKRVDRDADGDWDDSDATQWYQLCDSQFSVVAILDSEAEIYERIYYDAYGNADHRFPGDTNDDGNFDFFEISAIASPTRGMADTTYNSDFDLNFDGTIDGNDAGVGMSIDYLPVKGDWISSPTSLEGPDNSIGYAGYVFNSERSDYTVRNRVYSTELGRWLTRDPIGYAGGGANMFEYVLGNPVGHIDPSGLEPYKWWDKDARCDRLRNKLAHRQKQLEGALGAMKHATGGHTFSDLAGIDTDGQAVAGAVGEASLLLEVSAGFFGKSAASWAGRGGTVFGGVVGVAQGVMEYNETGNLASSTGTGLRGIGSAAAGGAAAGAAAGSLGGPAGAAVGAVAGVSVGFLAEAASVGLTRLVQNHYNSKEREAMEAHVKYLAESTELLLRNMVDIKDLMDEECCPE